VVGQVVGVLEFTNIKAHQFVFVSTDMRDEAVPNSPILAV